VRYETLTQPLWGKNKVIIWPEAAIPLAIQDISPFIEAVDKKARAKGTHLILGIPIQANSGYYNAVVSLGDKYAVYLKRRLVPFGEYMPMPSLLSPLFSIMHFPMSNIVPGRYSQPPFIINGTKILVSICYEIAFPELITVRDQTIGMLLTVTNDAWFGKSAAQAQHLQIAAMRAVEMRRPLLFVSNNGITAIINADGLVISAAPPRKSFVLNGLVQPTVGLTPWQRLGFDPLLLILLCLLLVAIRSKFTNKIK
jgi:apolipoprotein N-acyltransferase